MRLAIWLLCACAIIAAAASTFVLQRIDIGVVAAAALLAAAQLVAAFGKPHDTQVQQEELDELSSRVRKNSTDITNLHKRSRDYAQKIAELNDAVDRRMKMLSQPPAASGPMRALAAPDGRPLPPGPGTAAVAGPSSQLFLEPVVRLSEGRTAYYKATLRVPGQGGAVLLSAEMASAGTGTPGLQRHDLDTLNMVLPVVERLRSRGGATGIFCPLSPDTLANRPLLERYVATLKNNPDTAAGIVLDLNQHELTRLDDAGMRGLAWLAGLGATFCLTGATTSDNDLGALAELGFVFVDVPASGLMPAAGVQRETSDGPGGAHRFVVDAQSHGISVIASGVEDAGKLLAFGIDIPLARGPGFAAARAVRSDFARDAGPASAAAG